MCTKRSFALQQASVSIWLASARPCTLLLLVWTFAAALLPSFARAQHYTFARFGQNEGLLNLDVSAIVQDARGILWVGTENGVFRADSSHFVKVQSYRDAEEGSVAAMHADAAGRVWIAGSKRLVYITSDLAMHDVSGVDGGALLKQDVGLASLPGLPNTVFRLLGNRLEQIETEDGGHSWRKRDLLGSDAVDKWPRMRTLSSLAADPARNALWVGCGGALCQVQLPRAGAVNDGPSVSVWDSARGLPEGDWTGLLPGRDGGIWAAGTGELLRLDPKSWAVQRFPYPAPTKAKEHAGRLAEDSEGGVLATFADGLARLKDGSWERWTANNGLPPSEISTIFFDKRGGFWLAPVGGGIWRWLGYGNWQNWTRAEGLLGDVTWSILRDSRGRLWIASASNVYTQDATEARLFPADKQSAIAGVTTLAQDERGHTWAAGGSSIYDFDPKLQQPREIKTQSGRVFRLRPDAVTGRLWACTREGIGWLSAQDGWSALHMAEEADAPHSNVWGITQDRSGAMWFTGRGILYRFAGGAWTRIVLPEEAAIVGYASLAAAPDGTLWMQAANPHPLVHLAVSGNKAHIIGSVSGDVIGSDDISIIQFDRRGWLWIGTDSGLYVFDGTRWIHCTQEDGLVSDDLDTAAFLQDADGSMWFGTVSGLSHLLHPEDLFKVPPPQMSVRDVRLNGVVLQPNTRPRFDLRAPELSVDLFSTDYKRPRAVVFRYCLKGLDNRWRVSDTGSLRFGSLPAGSYVLSLQAVDTRVHELSPVASYAFEVLPPWYQCGWAKAITFLLTLVIAGLWWRTSLQRLRMSELTLKRKVDEQTAELLAEKEQLQRAQRELVESSRRDALTGLLNRSAIFEVLSRLRRRALESGSPLCIVMADLDHFKSINDRCGHVVGDAVLRETAERFQETVRPDDFVGRYGGEELLLVIPGLQREQAAARLEEIREAIAARPVVHGVHHVPVTASFGVAWLSEHNREIESVVNDADAALYMAKQNGRNRVEFAPELDDAAYTRSHLFEVERVSAGQSTLLPGVAVETG